MRKHCGNCVYGEWARDNNAVMPKICAACQYVEEDGDKVPSEWTPLPQTNADRIRAMSDEELAAFWSADGFCDICEEGCDHFTYIGDCELQFLRWLKQPVKDGEGE